MTIPSPMSEFVVSGMRYDFPKLRCYFGFGKSASLHSRNNHQIGEGIVMITNYLTQAIQDAKISELENFYKTKS